MGKVRKLLWLLVSLGVQPLILVVRRVKHQAWGWSVSPSPYPQLLVCIISPRRGSAGSSRKVCDSKKMRLFPDVLPGLPHPVHCQQQSFCSISLMLLQTHIWAARSKFLLLDVLEASHTQHVQTRTCCCPSFPKPPSKAAR